MDEQNVHHFWGISPSLDLGSLLPTGEDSAHLPADQPIRFLQVAPYDARHTLTTICRATRHPLLQQQQQQPVHLVVWEDSPEGLARHVLLLAVLLDGSLPPRERLELLMELHGNAVVRERAAAYLDEKARQLEALVVQLSGGGGRGGAGPGAEGAEGADGAEAEDTRGLAALGRMLDLSLLKFQEKDQLVEVLQKWRTTVSYDMVKAWDARARKWYGDRYDFRRNLVDWDYHMRLQPAGTPGQDPANGSIIHFQHFRHWRMHGVAHELRDSHYNQPNRSLLSTAYGRTREFKDRSLRDVGRSVSAWGFWGDILDGPYHCFGTLTEEPSFYKITNKQYSRTAVDVAEHNLTALLHELRTGERLSLAAGSEAPRAKVARGPTSLEDLQDVQQQGQGQQQQGQGGAEAAAADASGTAAVAAESAGAEPASASAAEAGRPSVSAAEASPSPSPNPNSTGSEQSNSSSGPPAPPPPPPPPAPSPPPPEPGQGPEQPLEQQQQPAAAAAVPRYASGGRALVAQAAAGAAQRAEVAPAAAAEHGEPGSSGADVAARAADTSAGATTAAGGSGADVEAAKQRMAEQEAALRAAEAALDAAGRSRAASLFRLQLVTGDLAKGVTGRAKYSDSFSAVTVGHRHIHMLAPEYQLFKAATPGAVMVAENARHLLQLKPEQAALFIGKMDELAESAGWRRAPRRPEGVTEASEVYVKPRAP